MVSVAAHPEDKSYLCALVVPANVTVMGAGRGATTVKLLPNQSSGYMVLNRRIASTGDENIHFADLTFDGNAAAYRTGLFNGVVMIRGRGIGHTRVRVQNVRGTEGYPPNERFHFDAVLSADVRYFECEAVGSAGSTATGFSANGSTNVSWVSCTARGMSTAHGFTHHGCRNLVCAGCRSYLNAGIGFNSEVSENVLYDHCIAGGSASGMTTAYPFTSGQSLGNSGAGFVINGTTAFVVDNCVSERNRAEGLVSVGVASGRIIGGVYRDNASYGVNLYPGTAPDVRFVGLPLTSGNHGGWAVGAYAFRGVGAVGNLPGRVGAAPPVPASNDWVTNPLPVPVDIYVVGGVITDVYIQDNSSLGPMRLVSLAPQERIAITYSQAPTAWVWKVT